ncbi:MAG: OmpA family protein [Bacteroidia bacterium]|nr:OmpA family protein [Bacteroidia bacterium]MDW8301351.1 OmpA family protein [Bacteroidia bacterium]
MRGVLAIIGLFLIRALSFAQPEFAADYKEAKYYEDLEDYQNLLKVYERIYQKDTSNALIKYKIGQVYAEKLNQPEKAMSYFIAAAKSGGKNIEARLYYIVGNYYKSKGKFQEALYMFQKYLVTCPIKDITTVDAEKSVKHCKVGIQLLKRPIISTTTNMGPEINSPQEDNHIVIAPDESFILFASNRPDKNTAAGGSTDIFMARRVTGVKYANPVRLPPPVNTNGYDIPLCLMPDGKTLYIFNSLKNEGDIYVTTLDPTTGKCTPPQPLPPTINRPDSYEGDATLSPDGKMIIFTSDREGGIGGKDLYISYKDDKGEWQPAQLMGFNINTDGDEFAPFYHAETKTLYFSSNKHPGIGETDIFRTTLQPNNTWTPPENLGIPINTYRDDEGFVISPKSKVAYSCSRGDVKEREGYQDIYQINIPKGLEGLATVSFTGVVKDKRTQKPLEAKIIIEDIQAKQRISELTTDPLDGSYTIILAPGKEYAISITAPGYLFTSDNIVIPADTKAQEITKNQFLTPISKGEKVTLNNIFFDTGKATLKPQSILELNRVVALMQANPRMKIRINGHTDNQGDEKSNLILSEERAKSVADYLIKANIAQDRIQTKGFGQSQPIADNSTEEGRRLNRRTELEIIE